MYHVLFVDAQGIPGAMYGPGEWDDCVNKIVSEVKKLTPDMNPENDECLSGDGNWENVDGSTWYIVCPDPL